MARLAELILGLSMLVLLLEITGVVGAFRQTVVMLAVPIAGMAVGRLARRSTSSIASQPHESHDPQWELLAGLALVSVVFIQWLVHAAAIAGTGMRDMDSLRYHGPFVARWVQQHSLVHLEHTSGEVQETFFPANAELLHAYGVLLFGRDILTSLLNLVWYGVGVLAAWCTATSARGRTAAIAGFAALCSTPLLSSIEPGSAKNDLAAAVLVLCLAAFITHASATSRGPFVLAGLAAGLAVGTKLTVLAPVVVLLGGAIWLATRDRSRVATELAGGAVLTGSFWYVRNLVLADNPLPWLRHLGPVAVPGPAMTDADAHGFSVLHYVGDGWFWTHVVPAGLLRSFGPLYLMIVIGAVGAGLLAATARHVSAQARLVGIAAISGMVSYLATPFSAGGTDGHPGLFALDLRFLAPALVLAAVAAARGRLARPTLVIAAAIVSVDQWYGRGRWPTPSANLLQGAAVLAGLGFAGLVAVRYLDSRQRVGIAALLATVIAAMGWRVQAGELDRRYSTVDSGLTAAYAMFRNTHALHIAVGGFADDYPLYGVDLSNQVQFIGVPQPDGGFRATRTCREWRTALAAGHYDDVVLSRSPVARQRLPVETRWTATDSAAHLVFERGVTRVYRLDGSPDPKACPRDAVDQRKRMIDTAPVTRQ